MSDPPLEPPNFIIIPELAPTSIPENIAARKISTSGTLIGSLSNVGVTQLD